MSEQIRREIFTEKEPSSPDILEELRATLPGSKGFAEMLVPLVRIVERGQKEGKNADKAVIDYIIYYIQDQILQTTKTWDFEQVSEVAHVASEAWMAFGENALPILEGLYNRIPEEQKQNDDLATLLCMLEERLGMSVPRDAARAWKALRAGTPENLTQGMEKYINEVERYGLGFGFLKEVTEASTFLADGNTGNLLHCRSLVDCLERTKEPEAFAALLEKVCSTFENMHPDNAGDIDPYLEHQRMEEFRETLPRVMQRLVEYAHQHPDVVEGGAIAKRLWAICDSLPSLYVQKVFPALLSVSAKHGEHTPHHRQFIRAWNTLLASIKQGEEKDFSLVQQMLVGARAMGIDTTAYGKVLQKTTKKGSRERAWVMCVLARITPSDTDTANKNLLLAKEALESVCVNISKQTTHADITYFGEACKDYKLAGGDVQPLIESFVKGIITRGNNAFTFSFLQQVLDMCVYFQIDTTTVLTELTHHYKLQMTSETSPLGEQRLHEQFVASLLQAGEIEAATEHIQKHFQEIIFPVRDPYLMTKFVLACFKERRGDLVEEVEALNEEVKISIEKGKETVTRQALSDVCAVLARSK